MKGKVIAVTGASSGIGEAAARQLAMRGAIVLLIARRGEELRRVRDGIVAGGGQAHIYVANLADADSVSQCTAAMLAEQGRVDVLVNNAGRSIRRKIVESLDRAHDYERTIQLNYLGAVRMTLALLPGMVERDDGHIINVSSQSTLMSVPRFSAYVGSKCALEGFSRSLAVEFAGTGITATVIHYPLVRTAMSAPTKLYSKLPMMSAEEAGAWVVRAVEKRPARIAPRVGEIGALIGTLMPGTSQQLAGRFWNYMAARLQKRVEHDSEGG